MKRNESLNSLYATTISDFHNMRNSSQKASFFLGTEKPFTHLALSFSRMGTTFSRNLLLKLFGRIGLFIHFFGSNLLSSDRYITFAATPLEGYFPLKIFGD